MKKKKNTQLPLSSVGTFSNLRREACRSIGKNLTEVTLQSGDFLALCDPYTHLIYMIETVYEYNEQLACKLLSGMIEGLIDVERKRDPDGFWTTLAKAAAACSTSERDVYAVEFRLGLVESRNHAANRVYRAIVDSGVMRPEPFLARMSLYRGIEIEDAQESSAPAPAAKPKKKRQRRKKGKGPAQKRAGSSIPSDATVASSGGESNTTLGDLFGDGESIMKMLEQPPAEAK